MIFGVVRGNSPRIRLFLPGQNGPLEIEMVVDTGFESDLALPIPILHRLDAELIQRRLALMPDGREEEVMAYEMEIEWPSSPRNDAAEYISPSHRWFGRRRNRH